MSLSPATVVSWSVFSRGREIKELFSVVACSGPPGPGGRGSLTWDICQLSRRVTECLHPPPTKLTRDPGTHTRCPTAATVTPSPSFPDDETSHSGWRRLRLGAAVVQVLPPASDGPAGWAARGRVCGVGRPRDASLPAAGPPAMEIPPGDRNPSDRIRQEGEKNPRRM